ncbi:hypothetical protein ACFLYB_06110 [Chloroflexota bacterium]
MRGKTCPECGCSVGEKGYDGGGVIYCCKICADGKDCECNIKSVNMPDSDAPAGEGEPG